MARKEEAERQKLEAAKKLEEMRELEEETSQFLILRLVGLNFLLRILFYAYSIYSTFEMSAYISS